MAQFTIYQNKNLQSKKSIPFLLDIQSDLLDSLQTTVVVPLTMYDQSKDKAVTRLMPILNVEGTNYLMLTPQLAGISRKELGKPICDVEYARTEIINAIDFLLLGI